MFDLSFTLPVYILFGLVLVSATFGYVLRSAERMKLRTRVLDLEKENHDANAHLLELEAEILQMENKLKAFAVPVIPLKKPAVQENSQQPSAVEGISHRKQLLGKALPDRHSASR